MQVNYYTDTREDTIDQQEYQLYQMIMDYRASLGLPSVPLSKALTITASRHVVDTVYNLGGYDGHNWSDSPYNGADRATYPAMWYAPERIGTGYSNAGFEISTGYLGDPFTVPDMTPELALQGWQGSKPHDDVIAQRGVWDQDWQAIGVAIHESVSHVWFGQVADPTGQPDFDPSVVRPTPPTGQDTPQATPGADVLTGTAGNDTLAGGDGNDILQGGAGIDTAVFTASQNSTTIKLNKDGTALVQDRNGSGGTDMLSSIEVLNFSDGALDLEAYSGAVTLSAAQFTALAQVYVAYFNRAADAKGLYFWADKLAEGLSMNQIADAFFLSSETQALYPDPANTDAFVAAVYNNVLGRTPDASGFAFWKGALEAGTVTQGGFVLSVIGGAQGQDITYLANKANLGVYFSALKGMSDVADAQNVMQIFGAQSASNLSAAKAAIDTHYADAMQAGGGEALFELVGVVSNPFDIA